MAERRRLGRGIGALIPTTENSSEAERPIDIFFGERRKPEPAEPEPEAVPSPSAAAEPDTSVESPESAVEVPAPEASGTGEDVELVPVPGARFVEIPVDFVRPNERQPRTEFDEDELSELASSIAEVGVLQPIVVRPIDDPDYSYELIMGERRWRASSRAGLELVPAIVRDTADSDLLRDALLENLHRVQLNPLEEASAYRQLLDDFGCTQEELSRKIARSRPQISNTLRLLKLPPLVQRRVAAGVLSSGHARALLGLTDAAAMERLAQRIVAEGLSVRAVEEIVALGEDTQQAPQRRTRVSRYADELGAVAQQLGDRLDTRVKVTMGASKGKMTVDFGSLEDLSRILAVLGVSTSLQPADDQTPEAPEE